MSSEKGNLGFDVVCWVRRLAFPRVCFLSLQFVVSSTGTQGKQTDRLSAEGLSSEMCFSRNQAEFPRTRMIDKKLNISDVSE